MSEWTECRIGKVVDLQQGLCINSKSKHLLSEEGHALLRITDLINSTEIQFINRDKVAPKFISSPEDIIYTRTGQVGLVFKGKSGVIHNNCFKVIPSEKLDSDFLFWVLRSQYAYDYANGVASGAAQPDLAHGPFKSMYIRFPARATQRKIAAILTAYDELIETNKRRIALLEKMAEELYREWFVRMRFPGHQNTKFVKGVPEGWEVRKISEVYQTASGGTPSRKTPEYFDGEIQWLKTGELKGLFTPDSDEKISQSAIENSAAKVFPSTTIIMAMYCAMPDISIATYDSATNQACCAFLPKSDWLHYGFNYYLLRDAQKQLVMFAHGAAQQNLSQDIIRKFPILLPSKSLIEEFGNKVEPLLLMIREIEESNKILTQTRDLLLPRLISGKLSVEDLDIQFPPSMCDKSK